MLDRGYLPINYMLNKASRWTLLIFASRKGKDKVVDMLCERGADMAHGDVSGMTAVSLGLRVGGYG